MKKNIKKIWITSVTIIFLSIASILTYILYFNWRFSVQEDKYNTILESIVELSSSEEIDFGNVVPFEWDEMYYIGIPYISEEHFISMINDSRIRYKDIVNDASGRLIFLNNNKVVFDWYVWADELIINDEYLHIRKDSAVFKVSINNDGYITLNYIIP